MRFANPRSSGAQTTSFCRLIFFCALYLALPRVYATNGAAPGPESQLESLLHGTNLLARAFLRNDQIRFYSPAAAQWLAFQAEWKHSRAPAHEFKYASATLASHNPLPQLPNLSHWHEAQVLPSNDAARLFHSAADLLVPREPSHGVFCHYAFGDAVLFRDPSGKVQLSSGEEIPDDILIERRYNRQELAAAAATVLETNLLADYPNQTAFILPIGSGNQFRLALLDFTARNIVILYLPRKSDEPRLVSRLGLKLSNLVSLVLVDNAWTFLKNPVSASARTFHQWLEWPLTVITPRLRANRETIPPLTNASGMDLAAWERWLDQHTHTWRELGSLRLLIDGDGFFPILEHRIAEAQSNINFQVCIFDSDDIAVGIADQLKQLSTNLDIKIVFDRLMSRAAATSPPATPMPQGFTPPNSIATYLRQGSKVKVRPQPNPGFTADHSKVLLVDGRYVFLGGMNIGREYRYEWHDLMAEIQGPIVASFERKFDKKWAQVGPWGDAALTVEGLRTQPGGPTAPAGTNLIALRRLYTRPFDHQIRCAELEAIKRASSYVFAENPYFFSNEFLIALTRARKRGVDVRVLMPSENDLGIGHNSNLVIANYFLEHGVRVYFYPGMTHVKALLVDGWACFGSANFDALSLRLNREANLAASAPAFAAQFKHDLFETDFARSRELKEPLSVGWSDYLADALLTPF